MGGNEFSTHLFWLIGFLFIEDEVIYFSFLLTVLDPVNKHCCIDDKKTIKIIFLMNHYV